MKIKFPEIVREIDLADYVPEVEGKLQVWVNPPVKLLQEYSKAINTYVDSKGEEGQDELLSVISQILSKKDDGWTEKDLKELVEGTRDTDPAFFGWLLGRIIEAIAEHRAGRKKVLGPPQPPSQAAAGQMTNT